jgi:glycosyltransferase involved in cell wall biosynthesis
VIDIHYRLKALSEAGLRIDLHVWHKGEKPDPAFLLNFAESVHFYPRKKPWQISRFALPFIVSSRQSTLLAERISAGNTPIWCEGIHTTGVLNQIPNLSNRKVFLRAHNIEQVYYGELAKRSHNLLEKAYYKFESDRLKTYEEGIFPLFNKIFAISPIEQIQIEKLNPQTEWLPAFVQYRPQKIRQLPKPDAQDFKILFHGNFEIQENRLAAQALIRFIKKYSLPGCGLVLAGKGLDSAGLDGLGIEMYSDPTWMDSILDGVDLVLLPGTQLSGVKIKLLESLAAGKRVICSPQTAMGSGLESKLISYTSEEELYHLVQQASQGKLDSQFIEGLALFHELYNPQKGVKQIVELL